MGIRVGELLRLVSEDELQKIGVEIGVDKPNQKLTGKRVFMTLLYSLAETNRVSLRLLENVYNSAIFQMYVGKQPKDAKGTFSSFSDRLGKIKSEYFEAIFNNLVTTYSATFPDEINKKIKRFDSTLMGLSARLFKKGINCGGGGNKLDTKGEQRYLKITIGQKGAIPYFVRFCTEQAEASEDKALPRAIAESIIEKEDIVLFDRGIHAGKAYIEFSKNDVMFVTRVNQGRRVNVVAERKLIKTTTSTINIFSDQTVQLWNSDKVKFFTTQFRLIKAKSLETNEELWFLTNIFTLDVVDITDLYKKRWDIEVFFRFIKQELNLKHFLTRSLNGIKTYTYMILIFAILLLIYKTKNNRTGYKIVKWDFFHELQVELTIDIVRICGGDPNIFLREYGLLEKGFTC